MQLIFLLVIFVFIGFRTEATTNPSDRFRIPKSTIDAAERKIESEKDPYKRLQLVIRWVKLKSEYDKNQIFESPSAKVAELETSKDEIIKRIQSEFEILFRMDDQLDLSALTQELAFRYQEMQKHETALEYFYRLPELKNSDQLAMADSLIALDRHREAIQALNAIANDPKLKNLAAYKKAWSYLRVKDHVNALVEFDSALEHNPQAEARLYEEAYQDRVIPYLEIFTGDSFTQTDAQQWKDLAKRVFLSNEAKAKQMYVEALKSLVHSLTAKSEIAKARQAFRFVELEMDDPTAVLILSAPTWIQVYRGRLDHASVEAILDQLPRQPMNDQLDASKLKAELYNTASFYETFKENDKEQNVSPALLKKTYKRYFQLFPKDLDVDDLRINYGKLLLSSNEAGACYALLQDRSKNDEQIEKVSLSLEAKCELKHLDQLFAAEHTDFFRQKLVAALLDKKIYKRQDLGLPAEEIFENMVYMLTGSIAKKIDDEFLRASLKKLIDNFEYPNNEKLLRHLKVTQSELLFQDILDSNLDKNEKAEAFYQIFLESPVDAQIAEKSLLNSVLLGTKKETLERCDEFKKTYPQKFNLTDDAFNRCVEISEHFLDLGREYSYWQSQESRLSKAQQLRLGIVELALAKPAARQRLTDLGTEDSVAILQNWDATEQKQPPAPQAWQSLTRKSNQFTSRLKPITFSQIEGRVPQKISEFEKIDSQIVKFIESQPALLYVAEALYLRSVVNDQFATWLENLPGPTELSEEELQQYELSAKAFTQPWREKASLRTEDCGAQAHALSVDFKTEDSKLCPESTPTDIYQERVNNWRSSIQRTRRMQPLIRILLKRAEASEDINIAKYLAFRAISLSKTDTEKAKAYEILGEKTGRALYWHKAYSLDGFLAKPIQWHLEQAKGNPFFEKLYSQQLTRLRALR